MSRRGNGTFRDFTSGQDINFLKIDYTAIKRTYAAKNLLATNVNAFPSYDSFLPDSDGDGLDDDTEMRNGTDPLMVDSDSDGYQDFLEEQWRSSGFDPMDATRPDEPCNDQQDSDGDGLRFCEEQLFDTDDKLVDSDADGFPDLYEVRFGTDPVRKDTGDDLDADGRRNADELLFHTHPGRSDAKLFHERRYWYELREVDTQLTTDNPLSFSFTSSEDRQCYDFDIRYISLVTTRDRNGPGTRGFNDVLIWFDQSAYDDPLDPGRFRVACVRAQYIAPDYKIPVTGEVTLTDEDFVDPQNLDVGFAGGSCVTGVNQ
jgi:hypothetical protein